MYLRGSTGYVAGLFGLSCALRALFLFFDLQGTQAFFLSTVNAMLGYVHFYLDKLFLNTLFRAMVFILVALPVYVHRVLNVNFLLNLILVVCRRSGRRPPPSVPAEPTTTGAPPTSSSPASSCGTLPRTPSCRTP